MSETVRLTDDLCLGRSDGGDGGQSAKAASGLPNIRYTNPIAMKAPFRHLISIAELVVVGGVVFEHLAAN